MGDYGKNTFIDLRFCVNRKNRKTVLSVGSWQLAVVSCQLAVVSWQL